jgi:hypothetical protein
MKKWGQLSLKHLMLPEHPMLLEQPMLLEHPMLLGQLKVETKEEY